MISERPAGLAVLPERYGALFDRAVAVFESDERVRGMWLHGAIARGAADAGSDLDVNLAVADAVFDAFAAAWPEWLAQITPTVNASPIPGLAGSFYALTPTCARLDVISERVSDVARSFLTRRVVVFDRDGLTASVPAPLDPPLLYQLFAEANKPLAPTGPKQWSHKLSVEHRRMLEALPVPQPDPDSVEAARQAATTLFLSEAPKIAAANDVAWPEPLVTAVLDFLRGEGLGVEAG